MVFDLRNVGAEPGEHLVTLIPGGMEKVFRRGL
jgi:hypothetical protein